MHCPDGAHVAVVQNRSGTEKLKLLTAKALMRAFQCSGEIRTRTRVLPTHRYAPGIGRASGWELGS